MTAGVENTAGEQMVEARERVRSCVAWLSTEKGREVLASQAAGAWLKLTDCGVPGADENASDLCDMEVAAAAKSAACVSIMIDLVTFLGPREDVQANPAESTLHGRMPRPWLGEDGSWDAGLAARMLARLEGVGERLPDECAGAWMAMTAVVLHAHGEHARAFEAIKRAVQCAGPGQSGVRVSAVTVGVGVSR